MNAIRIKLVLVCFIATIPLFSYSQEFGDEWIDFSKSYWKIGVNENGLYRITQKELIDLGFPTSVDPRQIKLFFRGKEMAIQVSGQDDGVFDTNDFIEFYGIRNDAWLDDEVYELGLESSTNPLENLYDDHTFYFLTYGGTLGKRMINIPYESVSLVHNYHLEKSLISPSGLISFGKVASSTNEFKFGSIDPDFTEGSGIRIGAFEDKEVCGSWDNELGCETWGEQPRKRNLQYVNHVPFIDSKLTMRVTAATGNPCYIDFSYEGTNGVRTLENTKTVLGNKAYEFSFTIPRGDLLTNASGTFTAISQTQNRVTSSQNSGRYREWSWLGEISLTYPQSLTAGNNDKKLTFPSSGKAIATINDLPANPSFHLISDVHNVRTFSTSGNAITIPSSSVETEVWVSSTSKRVDLLEKISFPQYDFTNKDYLIISHSMLRRPSSLSADAVAEYASYRRSTIGGGYNPIIANIEDLYNLYAHGERNPIAIKRFVKKAYRVGKPEFLFLIGKSRLADSFIFKRDDINNLNEKFPNLVPAWGQPHCDNCYSQKLVNNNQYPMLATGRIAAVAPEQVIYYLNKVREHESLRLDDLWRKNVLHLSGGQQESEVNRIKTQMDGLKVELENSALGAKVKTISKKTTDEVEFIDVIDEVNEGLSMITFMGHSSPEFSDIEIGYVTDDALGYNNKGKYPLIIVNGCNSGAVSSNARTFGEDWILAKDRGAILFTAHSHLGYLSYLRQYTEAIYKDGFGDTTLIHKPFGVIVKEATKKLLDKFGAAKITEIHVESFTLQGDPAVSLFPASKPDYAIDVNSLFIQGINESKVVASSDSFNIGIVVKNLGRASKTPIQIEVKRTFSNGQSITYPVQTFNNIPYQDTLYFKIINSIEDQKRGIATNSFNVTIDPATKIPEMSKANNSSFFNHFFPSSSIKPVFPAEFSFVDKRSLELYALNTDILFSKRRYRFQVDTTDLFNSSRFTESIILDGNSPKINFTIPSDFPDSTTFFWRVRYADLSSADDSTWGESSFTFINEGPEGWSQNHFFQYKKNTILDMHYDRAARKMQLKEEGIKIKLETQGANNARKDITVEVDGIDFLPNLCRDNSLIAFRLNGTSYTPRTTTFHTTEQAVPIACGVYDPNNVGVAFPTQSPNGNYLSGNRIHPIMSQYFITRGFLEEGDIVILISKGNIDWDASVPNTSRIKEGYDAAGIDINTMLALNPGDPFIAVVRYYKNNGSKLLHLKVPDLNSGVPTNEQSLTLDVLFGAKFREASMSSTLIGPAKRWGSYYRHFQTGETPQLDWGLKVYGVDTQGKQTLLLNDSVPAKESAIKSLSSIDATVYPYLKFEGDFYGDTSLQKQAQLDKWEVYYAGYPDGMLLFDSLTLADGKKIEKIEGDSISYTFRFRNISSQVLSKDLPISYSLHNLETNKRYNTTVNLGNPELKGGEEFVFQTIKFPTLGWAGENVLNVNANDNGIPEVTFENNSLQIQYKVIADNTHPVLDVLFDGRYILDGDIVSPSPEVLITLKDDNQFMNIGDTLNLDVLLSSCDSCGYNRLPFDGDKLRFDAVGRDNFQAIYKPDKLEDGIYTLQIQARDGSGNSSGLRPYRISFEVINESTVTNFFPYPNPFSTKVRFIFTLTGAEIPDEMKIQIMTISGKVVREITQDEIGPIHIGHNLTNYYWDGKDEYGDQLANGVYLYRVFVRKNGAELNKRDSGKDNLFKEGFGKMYLLK